MGRRKAEVIRPYPPEYVSATTLGYLLDISDTKRCELVAEGKLPPPETGLDGLERWCWRDVVARLRGIPPDDLGEPSAREGTHTDPYMRQLTKIRRHG